MKPYNVDYFIKFFEAIPAKQWHIGAYRRYKDGKVVARCALGHCGEYSTTTPRSSVLEALFGARGLSVASVNDKPSKRFPQATPKARILAALRRIKQRSASR